MKVEIEKPNQKSTLLHFKTVIVIVVITLIILLLKFSKILSVQAYDSTQSLSKMTNNAVIKWPKIILIGDSLTQRSFTEDGCWGSRLASRVQRKCDVVNRGFSGYNSRWMRIIFPKLIDKEMIKEIAVLTIFLGTNDATTGAQSVPVEEYGTNLVEMIIYLTSLGLPKWKIVVIIPPPCAGKWCPSQQMGAGASSEKTHQYAKECKSVAEKMGVNMVDTYTAMISEKNWQSFLIDGVHFNKEGSIFFEKLLWRVLEKLVDNIPIIYPKWHNIDSNSPEKSLK